MKRWLLHIWLTGVLGILAASCSQVIDDPVTGDCVMEKEKVMIRFTIALDSPKVASRTWDGYDYEDEDKLGEIGSIKENSINNVYALLYDLNGILMGQLDVIDVSPKEYENEEENKNEHIHTVLGSIEMDADKISNISFKLMILANCTLPASANLNNLETLTFTNPNTSDGSNIPMWGIATYEGVDLSDYTTQENPYDLTQEKTTPVYMLRSMAKIEVTLDSSMTGYTLEGATLSKAMNSGYVLPELKDATGAAKTLANLTATTQLGVDEVFRPITETATNTTSGALFSANNNTCVIYVPEYDNNTAEGLVINLTGLKKGDAAVSGKSFKHGNYNNDTGAFVSKLNVIRNHYYKYTVKMNEGSELEIELIANPWNVDEELIQFSNEVSISKMIDEWTNVTKDEEDASILYINGSLDASTAATATFKIDTPIGATWYASLEGNSDAFAFLDGDGNKVTSVTGNVGELATLKIITKEEHVSELKSVMLKIVVVTMDGRTIMVNEDLMPATEEFKEKEYYVIRQNLTKV